jgi:hypothetical protein
MLENIPKRLKILLCGDNPVPTELQDEPYDRTIYYGFVFGSEHADKLKKWRKYIKEHLM